MILQGRLFEAFCKGHTFQKRMQRQSNQDWPVGYTVPPSMIVTIMILIWALGVKMPVFNTFGQVIED